jgi:hypothetical protein
VFLPQHAAVWSGNIDIWRMIREKRCINGALSLILLSGRASAIKRYINDYCPAGERQRCPSMAVPRYVMPLAANVFARHHGLLDPLRQWPRVRSGLSHSLSQS